MTLEEKIASVIAKKRGNKEFALFYTPDDGWTAMLGNTCTAVCLGESSPEISGAGDCPMTAVSNLEAAMEHRPEPSWVGEAFRDLFAFEMDGARYFRWEQTWETASGRVVGSGYYFADEHGQRLEHS